MWKTLTKERLSRKEWRSNEIIQTDPSPVIFVGCCYVTRGSIPGNPPGRNYVTDSVCGLADLSRRLLRRRCLVNGVLQTTRRTFADSNKMLGVAIYYSPTKPLESWSWLSGQSEDLGQGELINRKPCCCRDLAASGYCWHARLGSFLDCGARSWFRTSQLLTHIERLTCCCSLGDCLWQSCFYPVDVQGNDVSWLHWFILLKRSSCTTPPINF